MNGSTLPPLPRSVRGKVPTLAELCLDLAETLTALGMRLADAEIRAMPDGARSPVAQRLGPDEVERAYLETNPREKARAEAKNPPRLVSELYRQQAATLRRRAAVDGRSAEDRADYEARAGWYEGRADAIDRGEPVPEAFETPSERFERLIKSHAATGLALLAFVTPAADELEQAEPCADAAP